MDRNWSRRGPTLTLLFGAAALLLLVRCDSGPGKLHNTPASLLGTWGGSGINMTIDNEHTAIAYACGDGAIDKPIILDGAGRFQVDGTFTGSAGPAVLAPRPARHSGSVVGTTMSLTVVLLDTGQSLGTFSLELGSDGQGVHLCV